MLRPHLHSQLSNQIELFVIHLCGIKYIVPKKDDSYIDSDGDRLIDIYKIKANATTVFADCIYRFDSHEKGLYVFAGLGLVNAKAEVENNYRWDLPSSISYTDKRSVSGSNLGFSLGLGYNLSSTMGLELSYVSASNVMKRDDLDNDDKKLGINWIQVSFKYRF